MSDLSPELETKFAKFRDSYEWAWVWLADAGGNAERKAADAFETAKRETQVSDFEEDLFRRLIREEALEPKPLIPPNYQVPIAAPQDDDDVDELFLDLPPIPKPE